MWRDSLRPSAVPHFAQLEKKLIGNTIKNASEQVARVRACNCVKFETGQNLPPVLKIVTYTAHTAHRHLEIIVAKHVADILFLIQFNNFNQTMGFHLSYTLLL